MNKNILVIGGGIETEIGVRHARALGYHVTVVDQNKDAPAMKVADETIAASIYDEDAIARALPRATRYDGVLSIGADAPKTIATLATHLRLPHPGMAAADYCADKSWLSQRLRQFNILSPRRTTIYSSDQLRDKIHSSDHTLVLKPAGSRGARGVIRLLPGVEPRWAYREALQYSANGYISVEEWIDGQQLSTESIVVNGRVLETFFVDRNYGTLDRFAPYVIEDGGQQPTTLSEEAQNAVRETLQMTATALGFISGILKGDLVIDGDGRVIVIEVAPRLSGGYMSAIQIPWAWGVDLIGVAIKIACGETITKADYTPCHARAVAIRYIFPPAGCISSIALGPEDCGVYRIHRSVGDMLKPVTCHADRFGCAIAAGDTRDEAIANAESMVASAVITTREVNDV